MKKQGKIIALFLILSISSCAKMDYTGRYTSSVSGTFGEIGDCGASEEGEIDFQQAGKDGYFRIKVGYGCEDSSFWEGVGATVEGYLGWDGSVENVSVSGSANQLRKGYGSEQSRGKGDATVSPHRVDGCIYLLTGSVSADYHRSGAIDAWSDSHEVEDAYKGSLSSSFQAYVDVMQPGEADRIIKKVCDEEALTPYEFVSYIQQVEQMNPGMGWKQIISKMHELSYPADSDLKIMWIPLFKNGRDNENYTDVELPEDCYPPKKMVGEAGQIIDLKHSYAGIRASLNRKIVWSDWMTYVNTDLGDRVQSADDLIGGMGEILWSPVQFFGGAYKSGLSADKQWENFKKASLNAYGGAKRAWNRKKWRPPEQKKGNKLGWEVMQHLYSNPNTKLSDALNQVMADQDFIGAYEQPCGGTAKNGGMVR